MHIPMHVFKKLDSHSNIATVSDGQYSSCRLFIKDKFSNKQFLIDTGADLSVVPPTIPESAKPSNCGIKIFAANGSQIRTFGHKILHLDF